MFDEKAVAVAKIRAKVLHAARCWLDQNNYIEVHGPTLIPAVGDWPGYFEVKYFDKNAYLTQGLEPYSNVFLAGLGRVYTIAPTFRAEKLKTPRHLAEFWRLEVAQQCDFEKIIQVQEELLSHVCCVLLREAREELKYVGRRETDLVKVRLPFPKLTYEEAVDKLQNDGLAISWGQRLDGEAENHLSLRFDRPFFVTEFPIDSQTLFCKPHPQKSGVTFSVDLFPPEGYGEISSGAQVISEKKALRELMTEENIDVGDQEWQLALMQDCPDSHSAFAIGIERLIQWICRLKNIREASAFPRALNDFYP